MFSKKASLEISIQAIVIVVLAMTLLGLGLGFIKGMFGNITKLSEGTFGKIEEQLQRDLVSSNEKLVFSQTKIVVERGKSVLLGWGIRNDLVGPFEYHVEFTPISCPGATPGTTLSCTTAATNQIRNWFVYKTAIPGTRETPYKVEAASQKVERVDLNVQRDNAAPGLYLIEMAVYKGSGFSDPYEKIDIFITVT